MCIKFNKITFNRSAFLQQIKISVAKYPFSIHRYSSQHCFLWFLGIFVQLTSSCHYEYLTSANFKFHYELFDFFVFLNLSFKMSNSSGNSGSGSGNYGLDIDIVPASRAPNVVTRFNTREFAWNITEKANTLYLSMLHFLCCFT